MVMMLTKEAKMKRIQLSKLIELLEVMLDSTDNPPDRNAAHQLIGWAKAYDEMLEREEKQNDE